MKHVAFLIMALGALLAISGCLGGNESGGNITAHETAVSEPQDNQDDNWTALVYVSSIYLYSDMKEIGRASRLLDLVSLKDASTELYNHATNALKLSNEYTVSPKLSSLKNNYEDALRYYQNAAIHMINGVDNANIDIEKSTDEITLAQNYIKSGTEYITQVSSELEKIYQPIRKLTFDIGKGMCVVNSTGIAFGASDIKNTLNTEKDSSDPKRIIQKTYAEFKEKDGSMAGFIKINVTTFKEDISSLDERKLLSNALDFAVDSEDKKYITEKKNHEAYLLSGKAVTVHEMYSPMVGFFKSSADVFSFMPDNQTIVTVVSSTDGGKTAELIKTFTIDDPPSFR